MSRDSTQYCAKGGYHGRLTYDSWNTYTWDGQGKLASVYPGNGTSTCGSSGWCLTYDALGRMVELNASGTYTEMLYSPIGKTAIMSGQTVTKVWYPVPGGGTVLASSSNWPHYQHADWLGTARLQTEFSGTLGNSPRTVDYDRSFAPFGEMYDSTGADAYDLDFTGDVKTMWSSGLLDTPNRELHPTQGRWISPDPAGLGAVDPASPQSWNRYAYVLNNPLSYKDPTGLDCAYLNDAGNDVESIDQSSNAGECGSNGGYWLDGGLVNYAINSDQGTVQLRGTTQTGLDLGGNTYASYQDTTLNAGWFQNTSANPFGHIAIGIGNNPFVGLNPASDLRFLGSLLRHSIGCGFTPGCNASSVWSNTVVPGAILPENATQSPLQNVSIPITGMQANMIQGAIDASTGMPPNYSVLGPQPACDCGTWAQQMMLAGGLQSGAPAWNPAILIEQLNQIYNPWW